MPVTTSVTYRVREEVLKNFMTRKFGDQQSSTGDLLWSYTEERDELRSLSEPAPTPVFGQRQ
uniref:Uncharacterized protein n=1 Tax=Gibberella zeae TaxID=5518 RepID=A0A4E9E9Q4_GIBZA